MGYIVFSAFDGMSCGQIAFKELGIKVDKYYASEVDKYAIMQTQHNFPNTIQLGSIVDVDVSKLDQIDLLIGGSPCQSFSFAGKRNGMSTVENEEIYTLERYLELKAEGFKFEGQSYLFWEYMRILTDIRKYNPNVKFLLENVEMGDKWERILSEAIGVFGVHINSALVSAQNRKRIYWTNIRVKEVGLFGELHSDIPQPKDEGILLKDILEEEVDEKYYLSEKIIAGFEKHAKRHLDRGTGFSWNPTDGSKKGSCLRANAALCPTDNIIKVSKQFNIKPNQDKASSFTAGGNSGGNHSDMDIICVAQRGRDNGQNIEPNYTGKTNCITSVQKDNLVLQLNPSKESGGGQPYQHNRVCDINGISPCLNTDNRSPGILHDHRIRRLTPTECAHLQTVPDWYKWIVSETQQYKMLGNGWTVKVIMHILNYLVKNEKN